MREGLISIAPWHVAKRELDSRINLLLIAPSLSIVACPVLIEAIYSFQAPFQMVFNITLAASVCIFPILALCALTIRASWLKDRRLRLQNIQRHRRMREYVALMDLEEISWSTIR